ncbi:MAG: VOC family protein [Gammaproteobacteria bacterium]|jgi:predicted enzyme related to lactoylglutathione lyase|nr:VOC family protein [Gammaproteobacteria bacterium]
MRRLLTGRLRGWRSLVAAVGLSTIAGCSTLQISLPPITEAPTNNRLTGKIVWHDLLTNDIEGSRAFYSGLFGWEFEEVPLTLGFGKSSRYLLIRHKGRLIGGMFDTRDADEQVNSSQWVSIMSVADLDAAVAAVTPAGGAVLTPPTDLAQRGRIAVVRDATGALFAMLQTANGDPLDDPPRPGEFMWDELWTDDIDTAVVFYQQLAPFESVRQPVASGVYQALAIAG